MFDLHTHSTESDGTLTPEQLIALAADEGITGIALTDHDCLSGNKAAAKAAEKRGIRFFPGIELDIDYPTGQCHLLGINLTGDTTSLNKTLKDLLAHRENRNNMILKKMNNQGIDVDIEELCSMAGGKVIGRPHFAKLMVKRGLVKDINEAFAQYLTPGKNFYIDRITIGLKEGLDLIHSAGGKSIIAHPLSLKLDDEDIKDYITRAKASGLDGLEAYHTMHTPAYCEFIKNLAKELDLIYTGGSDFHGENRPERKLGKIKDDRPIPLEIREFWK